MSRTLSIEGRPGDQLCTNRGWSDVITWAQGLNPRKYPCLCHLADHGYTANAPTLFQEIDAALQSNSPEDTTVHSTLQHLKDLITEAQNEDETIFITDGMIADDSDAD